MPTKVKELDPHKRDKDPRCPMCHPKDDAKWVREDQLWGACPTNAPHPAHALQR